MRRSRSARCLFRASPLAALLTGLVACAPEPSPDDAAEFSLPALAAADYHWLASRIYRNEARGQVRYLSHWGAGEDFPSLGIGHFIWFPAGVDAPFDESFPELLAYLREQQGVCSPMPEWLAEQRQRQTTEVEAPWPDKAAFDAALDSVEMRELRAWLAVTAPQQARYIAAHFLRRWNELDLPENEKQALTQLLQRMVEVPEGLYAVIDYVNFKGLGSNPRERYDGHGWGLLQVLSDVATTVQLDQGPVDDTSVDDSPVNHKPLDLVQRFSDAAANRLRQRVALSPPERDEARWLDGWLRRVAGYAESAESSSGTVPAGFRVTPYLQHPASTAMTLIWFSDADSAGRLSVRRKGDEPDTEPQVRESRPLQACELIYHDNELADIDPGHLPTPPFRHEVRLTGLSPATSYRYEVEQNGQRAGGEFRTAPAPGGDETPLRFMVYADSETEPESDGKHAPWGGADDAPGTRHYPVDQSIGYRENLRAMAERKPDFIAIAGDLVQSGGEQRDWDEFWKHNASIAARVPILPAPGNHEYFGGPGALGGYGNEAAHRSMAKYKSYFDLPDNGADDEAHRESYYALSWGPATLVFVDGNDGVPHRSAADSNWYLLDESRGGGAPAWTPGSPQYRWLEKTLSEARRNSRFIFVLFHAAPYSSGVHGLPPGLGDGEDYLPGRPLRALTPLLMRYGVAAVFNGHDEMYEHSVVPGRTQGVDGREREHALHFFVIGTGGDGLRGPADGTDNPYRVFLAHDDAPEAVDANGVLVDGGTHYGHVEVTIEKHPRDGWQARLEPVYVFPVRLPDGGPYRFERRVYDDVTVIREAQEARHDAARGNGAAESAQR